MPEEGARKRAFIALVALVVGIVGNLLNLAGLAEAFLKWKKLFEVGVLKPWQQLRDWAFALLPFDVPEIVQVVSVGAAASFCVVGYAFRGTSKAMSAIVARHGTLGLAELFLYLSMLPNVMILAVLIIDGFPNPLFEMFRVAGPFRLPLAYFYSAFGFFFAPLILWTLSYRAGDKSELLDIAAGRLAIGILAIVVGFIALLFLAADFTGSL
jgi:hypothetical protein